MQAGNGGVVPLEIEAETPRSTNPAPSASRTERGGRRCSIAFGQKEAEALGNRLREKPIRANSYSRPIRAAADEWELLGIQSGMLRPMGIERLRGEVA
jgi:hypothetical protein